MISFLIKFKLLYSKFYEKNKICVICNMKHYKIIILGGGIAGLYTAYKLQKYHKSIALIEKNDRLGGRIYTHHDKSNDIHIEGGAGRINYKHKLFNKLLADLHLTHKKISIPSNISYIDKNGNDLTDKKDKYMKQLYSFIRSYDIEKNKNYLNNLYLIDFLHKEFNTSFVKQIEPMFEYKSLLYKLNCYEFFKLFKQDYFKTSKYFILKGGLSQVTDALEKKIRSRIYLNTLIETIEYKNNNYILNNKFSCEHLICALPKSSLSKFNLLKKFTTELNSINEIPLNRIYEKYNDKQHPMLQLTKTLTDSKIQYIIPINKHIIMSSYTDLENADYWNQKHKEGTLKQTLNKELSKYLNTNLPKSDYIKMFYWKNGVGSWKKKVNTQLISNKMLNLMPNFYICGEHYSLYQGWCEGALLTSEKVIKLIRKQIGGKNTRKHRIRKRYNKTKKYV